MRLVNNTTQTLALQAATAEGARTLGTVEPGKQRVFNETVLSPRYSAVPAGAPAAHGTASASAPGPMSCEQPSPRPQEDVLLVCK